MTILFYSKSTMQTITVIGIKTCTYGVMYDGSCCKPIGIISIGDHVWFCNRPSGDLMYTIGLKASEYEPIMMYDSDTAFAVEVRTIVITDDGIRITDDLKTEGGDNNDQNGARLSDTGRR